MVFMRGSTSTAKFSYANSEGSGECLSFAQARLTRVITIISCVGPNNNNVLKDIYIYMTVLAILIRQWCAHANLF